MAVLGRRSSTAVMDKEEPPSGSRYRRAQDEDEQPRGRSRAASNGDGGGRSRSRSVNRDADDTESTRSARRSRGRSDEEENDKPLARQARGGWASFKKARENTSAWADRFNPPDEDSVLIIFLDQEPFDTSEFHFIRDLPQGMQKGYVCPGKKPVDGYPKGCPLCRVGDKARAMAYFNVAVLVDGDATDPEVKVWEVGPGYAEEIHRKESTRAVDGDLTSVYFEVAVEKPKRGAPKLHLDVVREEYLEKEWGIKPLSDAEFDALVKQRRGEGYVSLTPLRKMEEAAAELDSLGD